MVNNFAKWHSFVAQGQRWETTGTGLLLLQPLKFFWMIFGKVLFRADKFERSSNVCIILRWSLHRY